MSARTREQITQDLGVSDSSVSIQAPHGRRALIPQATVQRIRSLDTHGIPVEEVVIHLEVGHRIVRTHTADLSQQPATGAACTRVLVHDLRAQELSTKEIARRLELSESTVRAHSAPATQRRAETTRRALELREQGLGVPAVAAQLGVHPSTVTRLAPRSRRPRISDETKARIRELWMQNVSQAAIAEETGVTRSTVRYNTADLPAHPNHRRGGGPRRNPSGVSQPEPTHGDHRAER